MKTYDSKEVAKALILKLGRRPVRASILALPLITGCGAIYTPNPMHEGHIALMGDAKGVRAMFDGMNGFIVQGKASPDSKGAYFAHRELQEREITTREYAPGLLDGIFGSRKPTAEQGS